jgi:Putative MetA-pathway of phenol degradation
LLLLVGVPSFAISAQQPFTTDDAEVTPKHHFHFEFSNEFDILQRSSSPNLKQNTADFEFDYGILSRVEIGVEAPLLTIINAPGAIPQRPAGLGDMNLSLKYNFLTEREHSRRPALAIAVNLELPTGNTRRQLGSGLSDFYMNGILQRSLNPKTKLRLNGGILFSGNETTGVIGIKARGTVFTGGGSLVRQFTSKLDLGLEVTGSETRNFVLAKGQLQALIGGNYSVHRNVTLDFGIVAGKYTASPRVGVQVGVSVDW